MENIKALLEAAGAGFNNVVRTTVFMIDLGEFAQMNEVYARYFTAPYPARSTVQVVKLPRDVRVEIDVIAVLSLRRFWLVTSASVRSTFNTPGTPRTDFITCSRCLTSLISTVTSMRPRYLSGARLHVGDVGVDVGDPLAELGEHALAILDLDRQAHGVRRDVGALVPLDVDAALRVVHQVDRRWGSSPSAPTRPCRA